SAAFQWRFMYSPVLGIFNYFLRLLGSKPVEFLANKNLALYSIAFIDIWQWGLLFSVLILGLLEALPNEPIEAAHIDGATKWQLHRYLTLPLILPSLISLTFLKIIESLRSFDLIYVLTKGGPGIVTETIDLFAYQVGVGISGRISYASCISILMMIITVVLTTFIWRILKKWSAQ
ncbi:MAG: sugar ABC transporter permease, partial [Candidatus Atribacteria bacterium]|nr:sugar ABC transporter permease [Candidatus Atribacteria bacterium]